jgi:hypothetical protein
VLGSSPAQSQNNYTSQPELNNSWTKVSYKTVRSTQEGIEREAKHTKESEHWLNQTFTSNRYRALLEEMTNSRKLTLTDVKNISPFIQLPEQIEIKALADN